MLIINTTQLSHSTVCGFQHMKPQTLLQNNPPKNISIFNSKPNQVFLPLSSYGRLHKYSNRTRKYIMYSIDPGSSPSGPPPNIFWILAAAIAMVVPFINYKWGPLLKKKVEAAMQTTEDVAEAVEKVAEEVEKVAEEIADDLPDGGKLRKAVDFVEKFAERAAKDAGTLDQFIDKVQEEEDKVESFVESLKDESEDTNQEKPNDQN